MYAKLNTQAILSQKALKTMQIQAPVILSQLQAPFLDLPQLNTATSNT